MLTHYLLRSHNNCFVSILNKIDYKTYSWDKYIYVCVYLFQSCGTWIKLFKFSFFTKSKLLKSKMFGCLICYYCIFRNCSSKE